MTPRGFHDASRDEATVREWWVKWPDALVAVPTGESTELLVIDLDPDKFDAPARAWVEAQTPLLLGTRSHATLRAGGLHYLFRIPHGSYFTCRTNAHLSGHKRAGIDIRASGGYVIWWPLHGGRVTNERAVELPAGLIDQDARRDGLGPNRFIGRGKRSSDWEREIPRIMSAFDVLNPSGDYELWCKTGMALHEASGGDEEGFTLWHDWSSGKYNGEVLPKNYGGERDCRYHWDSFGKRDGARIDLGTLFKYARDAGWEGAGEAIGAHINPRPRDVVKTSHIRWDELTGDPPQRVWWIPDWMGPFPTLIAGAGGVGKTRLLQAVFSSLATSKPYLGAVGAPLRTLIWSCEDDKDEAWRTQISINKHLGLSMEDLDNLYIYPRLGLDNTLMMLEFGQPRLSDVFSELREQVNDLKIDVLGLDNIAQVYGGNLNDPHQVTLFVNALAGLVKDRPFCPVLLGHVAKLQGSEFSGTNAWENAMRMRWYLGATLPDQKLDEDEAVDPAVVYLAKRKANYSQKDYRMLRFQDGILVPEQTEKRFDSLYKNYTSEKIVYDAFLKLKELGIATVDSKNSPDFLPSQICAKNWGQGFNKRELSAAMHRLMADGKLKRDVIGKYANRNPRYGLAMGGAQSERTK